MKELLLGFIIIVFLAGCGINITNMPPKNDTIVVFGDSLVEGVGATEGNDLVNVLSKKVDKKFINYGVSGNTTRDALGRLETAISESPGVVMIILGGNDVLQKIPKEETFANLRKIVATFQETGAVTVVVGVRSGVIGDGRGDDYEKLAKETGSLYISDILQDVFGDRQYMADSVHPNDVGYEIIAERFAPIVQELYEE